MPTSSFDKSRFSIKRILSLVGEDIVIIRNGTALPSQRALVVEVNTSAFSFTVNGGAGRGEHNNMALVGYYGHPTETNLDVAVGDRFLSNNIQYEVIFLHRLIDNRVEARIRLTT